MSQVFSIPYDKINRVYASPRKSSVIFCASRCKRLVETSTLNNACNGMIDFSSRVKSYVVKLLNKLLSKKTNIVLPVSSVINLKK